MLLEIIGPYPPPYGGISNHIFRLLPFLERDGVGYVVYNQYDYESSSGSVKATRSSYLWWLLFLFVKNNNLVHFHQFSWFHFIYIFVFSFVNTDRVFITIHNEKLIKALGCVRWLMVRFLKYTRCKNIIVVSRNVEKLLLDAKVSQVTYLPAYVPPDIKNNAPRDSSNITAFFNVWKIQNQGSIEKYGIDLLLDLATAYSQVNFECFVSTPENIDLVREMLVKRSIDNCVILIGENLVDHFNRADVFLRLNRDDAFGVSIQEAMDCGVPAIASDVCARPVGAQLFQSGNAEDLFSIFEKTLKSEKEVLLRDKELTNYHLQLIDLYKQLLVLK